MTAQIKTLVKAIAQIIYQHLDGFEVPSYVAEELAEKILNLASNWHAIETAPDGERVLLFLERGEKGNGEIAVGMVFKDDRTCYWTWGGPNSGMDIDEWPTQWRPLVAMPHTIDYELRDCLQAAFERLEAAGATLHPVLEEPLTKMAELLGIPETQIPTESREIDRRT